MFDGFSPETIDFLWGIRFNNNRTWFQAHKQDYDACLYAPMKALAQEVYSAFAHVPGLQCKVARIYRDTRYAHDQPYKEELWFCLRQEVTFWSEHPGLIFRLTPECYGYGFGLLRPKAQTMQLFRNRLLEKPEEFLQLVQQAEASTGLQVQGQRYAREKPGSSPALEPYYSMKNLMAFADHPIDDLLFSPELAVLVRDTLLALLPLYTYCDQFK